MNWQYIAVYVIMALTVIYIVAKLVRKYQRVRKGDGICGDCTVADCALKELKRKNSTQCKEIKPDVSKEERTDDRHTGTCH